MKRVTPSFLKFGSWQYSLEMHRFCLEIACETAFMGVIRCG